MKLVLQRVAQASVRVEGKLISEIGRGLLILLGVGKEDDGSQQEWLAKKVAELRIYEDETGKMNRSLLNIEGEILLVSQFTLFADCRKGRRPGFSAAAQPEKAERIYQEFAELLRNYNIKVKTGVFGANMQVSLLNDGPVTIILER